MAALGWQVSIWWPEPQGQGICTPPGHEPQGTRFKKAGQAQPEGCSSSQVLLRQDAGHEEEGGQGLEASSYSYSDEEGWKKAKA